MKLLVTGGMGYIGGRFAEAIAADPDCSLVLTSRRPGQATLPARARLEILDPCDEPRLAKACAGCDAVVHLAGMSAAECARDPDGSIEARVNAARALLSAAAAAGVRRIVCVSSAHVYGAALEGVVDEEVEPKPSHPYGRSHLAAEQVMRAAHARGELDAVVIRLSNSFGAPANAAPEAWKLVLNQLGRQAVRERRMTLATAGNQRRDFIAMSEVCRALRHLCVAPATALRAGLFNVGGEWAPTIADAAGAIAKRVTAKLGFTPPVVRGAVADPVGAGPLDFRCQRLRDSGFAALADSRDAELDRLISSCEHESLAP